MSEIEVGYSVIWRDFVGDEDTTRDIRIIKCSSLDDFKLKMQAKVDKAYKDGNDIWKLEAPQIFESAFNPLSKGDEDKLILYYTDFCDSEPVLIWKERTCDFSRWNKLKNGSS